MDSTAETVTDNKRCRSVSKTGTACRAFATKGSDKCFFHCYSTEAWASARQARVRGGKASAKNVRIEKQLSPRLRGLLQLIESSASKVEAGEMTPATAQALSSLGNTLLRVYQTAETELQLRALESIVPVAPRRITAPTGRGKDINSDGID